MADWRVALTRLAQRAIGRGQVGLAVGVIAGEEQLVAGFGRARDDGSAAPTGETIFEIGSITKVFTALLLAEMVEEGMIGLEDRLDLHLPPGIAPPRRDRPITLAELASHDAGLPRDPKGTLAKVLRRPLDPYRALLDAYAAMTVDDLYATLARTRARQAGTRARYSNVGAGLLGHLLAARAGASYEEAVRSRICGPLGMHDTFVDVPDAAGARVAHGHTRGGRPRPPFRDPALTGAGSLRSTAEDMLRFLRACIDPPTERLGAAIEASQRPRARMGRRVEAGLGWLISPLRAHPRRMHWHNGGTGGFRSFTAFVRETRTAVIVLGNTNRSVDLLGLRLLETVDLRPDRSA